MYHEQCIFKKSTVRSSAERIVLLELVAEMPGLG